MIPFLVKLANLLDKRGQYSMAREIDDLIEKLAQSTSVEVPTNLYTGPLTEAPSTAVQGDAVDFYSASMQLNYDLKSLSSLLRARGGLHAKSWVDDYIKTLDDLQDKSKSGKVKDADIAMVGRIGPALNETVFQPIEGSVYGPTPQYALKSNVTDVNKYNTVKKQILDSVRRISVSYNNARNQLYYRWSHENNRRLDLAKGGVPKKSFDLSAKKIAQTVEDKAPYPAALDLEPSPHQNTGQVWVNQEGRYYNNVGVEDTSPKWPAGPIGVANKAPAAPSKNHSDTDVIRLIQKAVGAPVSGKWDTVTNRAFITYMNTNFPTAMKNNVFAGAILDNKGTRSGNKLKDAWDLISKSEVAKKRVSELYGHELGPETEVPQEDVASKAPAAAPTMTWKSKYFQITPAAQNALRAIERTYPGTSQQEINKLDQQKATGGVGKNMDQETFEEMLTGRATYEV